MKRAIYPGSFDPLTNGHLDIIGRALSICDHVLITISKNQDKTAVFSLNERKALIEEVFAYENRLSVEIFDGLLVDFVKKTDTRLVIRGLRAASDFEYEFQLAAMNRKLYPGFETIFLMTGSDTYFLSSRLIKEIAFLGGDVSEMVPPAVARELEQKRINLTR